MFKKLKELEWKCVLMLLLADLLGLTGPSPRPSTLEDVAQALGTSLANGGPQGPGAGAGRTNSPVDICVCPTLTKYIFKFQMMTSKMVF